MNGNKPDNFDLVKMIEAIPGQFEKVITEMTKTAEMIGKTIKENLDDVDVSESDTSINATSEDSTTPVSDNSVNVTSDDTPAPSSVDIPLTDDSETPASKSTLTVKDMVTLLEINNALDELHEALIVIAGNVGIGSDGLIRKLNKIISVIVNASVVKEAQETLDNPNEWICELLEDKTIDNERKAKMLLGVEKQ